jgi:dimethylaniline monooxygenase (N-oxide forming)
MATGLMSMPSVPSFPGQDEFKGDIYHAQVCKNIPEKVQGKHAVILGGGRTANELTERAYRGGAKSVTMVYRKPKWNIGTAPENLVWGSFPVPYFTGSRLGMAFSTPMLGHNKTMKFQDWFPWLKRLFWKQLETAQRRGIPSELDPETPIMSDFENLASVRSHEFFDMIREYKVKMIRGASIAEYQETSLKLTNGDTIPCDVVMMGTGFRPECSKLESDLGVHFEHDGLWLYRHIIAPNTRNLAFIGHGLGNSGTVITVNSCVWIGEMLRGNVKVPTN